MADDPFTGELLCPDLDLPHRTVQLRAWRTSDACALFNAFSDPEVQRFSWPQLRAYTSADAEDYLVQQERGRRAGVEVQWAMVDHTRGQLGRVSVLERRSGLMLRACSAARF